LVEGGDKEETSGDISLYPSLHEKSGEKGNWARRAQRRGQASVVRQRGLRG